MKKKSYIPENNPHKQNTGLKRLFLAFVNSISGFNFAIKEESAFRQELLLCLFLFVKFENKIEILKYDRFIIFILIYSIVFGLLVGISEIFFAFSLKEILIYFNIIGGRGVSVPDKYFEGNAIFPLHL